MKLHRVVESLECGGLRAQGGRVVGCAEFLWAFFQLFIASPLPFWLASQYGLDELVLSGVKSRVIHLSFALFLLFLLAPSRRGKSGEKTGVVDWVLAVVAASSVFYVLIFYENLAGRIAMPTTIDVVVALVGMALLMDAARRVIGFPIVVVACVFLLYAAFGYLLPDIVAHKGHDLMSVVSHNWLTQEGVFGVALGVSCNFVFMYVLFGALLEKAGAGGFFMKLSVALLRGSVGGPAKAAVIGSGFMGMMSGSSVANTVTVGSFTIPLMKRMGMSPEKAAAVEVSAGINGQITPPVMGAAAFLMSEFLALPYSDIVKHAFVPALMVYVGLLVIVHFEAKRLHNAVDMESSLNGSASRLPMMLVRFLIGVASIVLLFGFVHVLIDGVTILGFHVPGIRDIFQGASVYALAVLLMVSYIAILSYRPQNGSAPKEGEAAFMPDSATESTWDIFRQGLHYFIPVLILVWSLVVEKVSSSLACFWTNLFLIFMLLAEGVVASVRARNYSNIAPTLYADLKRVVSAMMFSSRNMLPIAVATATAGVVVGMVGLTGFGLSIGAFIDALAGNSVMLALLITAVICIVLGMGMPTTGCYIIVSTLVVPALSFLAHKNGLQTSPVALHLFVFYFGLMADVTPPVGIASYAAAAIAKANSFKTGVQSFLYNIKTMAIPFMFVFNGNIIMHGVDNVGKAVLDIAIAMISIVILSAGMQGFFFRRNKFYESIALVLCGIMLMTPGGIANFFHDNSSEVTITDHAGVSVKKGDKVRISYDREVMGSKTSSGYVVVPIEKEYQGGLTGLLVDHAGVELGAIDDSVVVLDMIRGGYVYSNLEEGDKITSLTLFKKNHNGYYVVMVTVVLLAVLAFLQRSRSSGMR